MSKFSGSNATTKPAVRTFGVAPTKTKSSGRVVRTHEGGVAYEKGDKTALFTLAVTNMVGEPTFYESGKDRDDRFRTLVRTVTRKDPAWIANFIPFLRDTANMRSASVVVAVEAAKVIGEMRAEGIDVDVSARTLINAACSRADEPAEVLGYWLANYGRKIPMGIKRGIADAANKNYNEKSALKYDGGDRGVRMGDVIELVHPKPEAAWQSELYKHLLDRRHGHVESIPEALTVITANEALKRIPEGERRAFLRERGNEGLAAAGFTWEMLSGWLPGGMDAEAWGAIIPSMGYMALLRNLRNFEEAKVDREVLKGVRARLADPDEVARSRQFPYRFWSAHKNSGGGVFFTSAVEDALDLSCKNIPALPGRTAVLIDTSGSMQDTISGRSDIMRYEAAALFAAAMAIKGNDVEVFAFGTNWEKVDVQLSVLKTIDKVRSRIGKVGYGTNTWPSALAIIAQHGPFDRLIVFGDQQDAPPSSRLTQANRWHHGGREEGNIGNIGIVGTLPANMSIYSWDLAGYANTNINTNVPGRYLLGGFTDAAFKMIPLLEAGRNAAWPWDE